MFIPKPRIDFARLARYLANLAFIACFLYLIFTFFVFSRWSSLWDPHTHRHSICVLVILAPSISTTRRVIWKRIRGRRTGILEAHQRQTLLDLNASFDMPAVMSADRNGTYFILCSTRMAVPWGMSVLQRRPRWSCGETEGRSSESPVTAAVDGLNGSLW